jgi:hypothetical protein
MEMRSAHQENIFETHETTSRSIIISSQQSDPQNQKFKTNVANQITLTMDGRVNSLQSIKASNWP